MHKRIAGGIAAVAILAGSAGAAFLIPNLVAAADPTTSPAAESSPAAASSPSTAAPNPGATGGQRGDCRPDGMHRGPGGIHAGDLSAAASALNMTEADLTSALQGGQSMADVASAQGVDIQTVIDAIVASDKAEIQAAVDAGTMTQAQADQRLVNLTAHVTDEVNGIPPSGDGHGRMGPPPAGAPGAPSTNDGSTPTDSPSSTSTTS